MTCQSLVPKKKRGPPATGQGVQIQVRIQSDRLVVLDAWISRQKEPLTRPEAVRRLVDQALEGKSALGAPNKKAAHEASKLASREIEGLADKSAPAEEQDRRKRRLVHGPKEFRGLRSDQPKTKGAHES